MKPCRPRSIRRGRYAAWTLVALTVLLTTLLTPPAAPRVSLTAANSSTSLTTSRASGTQDAALGASAFSPFGIYIPWDNNILSAYMLKFRAWYNISPGRNVAAIKLQRAGGESLIIVGASAGTQVLAENRNAIFDVFHDGRLLQNPPHNEYLNGKFNKFNNGGNFDSEMLIMRYIDVTNLLASYRPSRVIVDSEQTYCGLCAGRLDSGLDGIPALFYYNFPEPSPELSAIEDNKSLSFSEKRDEARVLGKRQKVNAIRKWQNSGMPVNGEPAGVSPETRQLILNKTLEAKQMVSDCYNGSSLGRPGGIDSAPPELAAFSSSGFCGEGEGTPGGLMKALTSGNLGGVDFSTLQMRYMSDDPDSTGLRYSFSGQKDTSATPQDTDTALNVLIDNAADLRTWLVLSPDEFWVNLNPAEPDRIIDSQLGQTNAGRELLDADFQLKRSSAALMNPNTTLGAQYWRDLAGSSPSVCYGSRMWIVPGQVQVREDGGSLYILKAQLAVKAVPDHVADMPADCHYDARTDARGQRLDQTMIVPLITKMVNTAPEYAPIRRAFMARIVAQWIRDRHASGQRTSFDSLIDSWNIGPAQLQDGWQPQQVFNAYVKSLKDGEFTYNTTFHQGGATYIQKITIGGVDFTSLNPTVVSAAQMNQQYPQLPQIAKASVKNLTGGPDGSIWLGGTLGSPGSGSQASGGANPNNTFTGGLIVIVILIAPAVGGATFGIRRRSKRRRKAI